MQVKIKRLGDTLEKLYSTPTWQSCLKSRDVILAYFISKYFLYPAVKHCSM